MSKELIKRFNKALERMDEIAPGRFKKQIPEDTPVTLEEVEYMEEAYRTTKKLLEMNKVE